MRSRSGLAAPLLILALAGVPAANAVPITFLKVADTNSASLTDPNSNFAGFGNPSISGGTVVFRAQTESFRPGFFDNGIYSYDGTSLHVVADKRSSPGDPTGAFSDFGDPSISGNNVAFGATFAPNDHSPFTSGLFIANGAGTVPFVDLHTASPTGPGSNFAGFGNPSISGGTVVFRAQTESFRPGFFDNGIYSYDGTSLHVVADKRSSPGDPTGAFSDFGDPSISGNNVAFGATFAPNDHSPFTSGLFIANGAGTVPFVDLHTASPTDPGSNFAGFGNPSISGGTVAFRAQTESFRPGFFDNGIYSYDGTSLHVVADKRSSPGDPTGAFSDFGDPSISGNNVAFGATFAPNDHSPFTSGLFVSLDGLIEEIIHVGDALDGLTIAGLSFGSDGIDGDSLAFVARFTDGSTAVYRADINTIPEPNAALLLGLAAGLMIFARRARRTRRHSVV